MKWTPPPLHQPLGFNYGDVYSRESAAPYRNPPGIPIKTMVLGTTRDEQEKARVISTEAVEKMRRNGASEHPDHTDWAWFAYQAMDLGSRTLGNLQFLLCGRGCTYEQPPHRMPDTQALGIGWRYLLVGMVDLADGSIVTIPVEVADAKEA